MGAGQRLLGQKEPTGHPQQGWPSPALQHGRGEREAPRNTAVMGESVSVWLSVTPSQTHQWGLWLSLALYYLPFQKLFHGSERTPRAHAAELQGHCSAVQEERRPLEWCSVQPARPCPAARVPPWRSSHVTHTMLQRRFHCYNFTPAQQLEQLSFRKILNLAEAPRPGSGSSETWKLGLGSTTPATPSLITRCYCFSPKEPATAQRSSFRNACPHQLVMNCKCPLAGFYTACEWHMRNGPPFD